MLENHYQILNVPNFSMIEEVKTEYKKLMKINHPDKGGSAERFNSIKNSYKFLENVENKKLFDEKLKSKNKLNRLSSNT
jgi:DnaJ-class molecular chaperone